MAQEERDLCKTCEHYWVDFEINPEKKYVGHCEILDAKSGLKSMDDIISYPCLKCPFNCYKKKVKL